MAQYLVLIYGDGQRFENAGPEVGELTYKEHEKFGANNHEAIVGGNALQDISTATSIRTDEDGKATVTDGPFVETKETLGGYYLIEAPDFDAALEIAKQVPARFGGVELRPIMVFD
jgi:hypothetical protein